MRTAKSPRFEAEQRRGFGVNFPSLAQYNEAIQHPARAFYADDLKAGKVRCNGMGLPSAACGGFALIYEIATGGRKYAIRCFHRYAPDIKRRYEAISAQLNALRSPYFVDFRYEKQGIRVDGKPYPIVRMAWAAGQTLGQFLEGNYRDAAKLTRLRASLRKLADWLGQNRIAHGDIAPVNVMVADDGASVQLIDYDGMYVPGLAGMSASDLGSANFQHPLRAAICPWNEKLDRFSFILFSIALSALAARPRLWEETQSDSDKVLFSANDFTNPGGSKIFKDIAALPGMDAQARNFAAICAGGFDKIPSLEEFERLALPVAAMPAPARGKARYISSNPVLDASNYDAALPHVGEVVELVGKVTDIKHSLTKYGNPYYFINFGDWRGNILKISVWNDYLKKNSKIDFNSLKGHYISVIGLLNPPYVSARWNYSHLDISLDVNTPLRVITAEEAAYRLNYETPGAAGRKQEEKEAAMSGNAATANSSWAARAYYTARADQAARAEASALPRRNNAEILQKIRNSQSANANVKKKPNSLNESAHKQEKPHRIAPSRVRFDCPSCHHVQVAEAKGDIIRHTCSHCHAEYAYNIKNENIERFIAPGYYYNSAPKAAPSPSAPASQSGNSAFAPFSSPPPSASSSNDDINWQIVAAIILAILFLGAIATK